MLDIQCLQYLQPETALQQAPRTCPPFSSRTTACVRRQQCKLKGPPKAPDPACCNYTFRLPAFWRSCACSLPSFVWMIRQQC